MSLLGLILGNEGLVITLLCMEGDDDVVDLQKGLVPTHFSRRMHKKYMKVVRMA